MAFTHMETANNQTIYSYSRNEYTPSGINVGQVERWLSTLGGGVLALYGMERLDLTGLVLTAIGGGLVYRGITGHSFLYQTIGMSTTEQTPTVTAMPDKQGIRVHRAMTIRRPPEDLYKFWRDVEKAPLYMANIESVMKTGDRISHWLAKGSLGNQVEWDAEIVQDEPGRLFAWRVQDNPMVAHTGKGQFAPAPDGLSTVVTLELDYQLLRGPFTSIGKVLGTIPERVVMEELRHFKELMEAGEIPTIKGQPTDEESKEDEDESSLLVWDAQGTRRECAGPEDSQSS